MKASHKLDYVDLKEALKKKAYCHIKLYEFEEALYTLEKIEYILETDDIDLADAEKDEIADLMAAVQFQLFKYPSLTEYISKSMTAKGYRNPWNNDLLCKCGYDIDAEEDMDLTSITPMAPPAKTKTSGHIVSYA